MHRARDEKDRVPKDAPLRGKARVFGNDGNDVVSVHQFIEPRLRKCHYVLADTVSKAERRPKSNPLLPFTFIHYDMKRKIPAKKFETSPEIKNIFSDRYLLSMK